MRFSSVYTLVYTVKRSAIPFCLFKWVGRREESVFKVIVDGTFALVRPAPRPDANETTIEMFNLLEEAQKHMNR